MRAGAALLWAAALSLTVLIASELYLVRRSPACGSESQRSLTQPHRDWRRLPQLPHRRYAVIFHGGRMNTLLLTAESWMRHCIAQLDADVFIYGTVMNDTTVAHVRRVFGAERLKGVVGAEQIDGTAADAWINDSFARHWSDPKLDCTLNIGVHTRAAFYSHLSVQHSFKLLQGHERVVRDGLRYEWVMFSRPDFEWLVDMPPMPFFKIFAAPSINGSDRIWLPARTPYGGYPEGKVGFGGHFTFFFCSCTTRVSHPSVGLCCL